MIKLKGLTKRYGNGQKGTLAADDITFDIEPGEIFGFIGPNGAGKTTVLKMMTGIIEPTAGSAEINGFDILKNPVEAKQNFIFVPDHPEVFSNISGIDYLKFVADLHGVPRDQMKDRVHKLATEFSLMDDLGSKISTYSHGMKQKLLIISAFMIRPKVLLFDEPHVGLDPHAMKLLKDKMKEFCQSGGTVFFSSHILEAVENLCHRIAIISHGKIVRIGTLEELRADSDKSLEDIFLELTE